MRHVSLRLSVLHLAWLSLALVLGTGAPGQAQDLRPSTNPLCDWELRGVIESGIAERFDRFAPDWPPQTLLCLESEGGNLIEAAALFDSLFAADVATVIPPGWRCESACAIAFLAGGVSAGSLAIHWPQRILYPGGRLGFHAPSLDLPETGGFTSDQVTAAFTLAISGADRIVQISQVTEQGNTPLNSFLLRRILGTPPEAMVRIDTIVEAALADLEVAGLPGPTQLNAETAENACDLAITRHQQRYRRSGVDLAALLEGLAELRLWRRETEHAEIRIGTARMGDRTVAQALVTHYPTDVARHMLACEITLGIEPDAVPGTRHSLNHAPQRMALIVLRDHRWGLQYGQDVFSGEPRKVARFSVPAWFLHPPETPLADFCSATIKVRRVGSSRLTRYSHTKIQTVHSRHSTPFWASWSSSGTTPNL